MSRAFLVGLLSASLAASLALASAACGEEAPSAARVVVPALEVAESVQAAPSAREELAAHRRQQIERLRAYSLAGAFPHNTTSDAPLHMFRDAQGNLCAVANLIHQDGRDDLVEATVKERNDLAVADLSDGPVMDWVLASGLTKEEVVRIQAPAVRVQPPQPPRPVAVKPVAHPAVPVAVAPAPKKAITEAEMQAAIRAHIAEVLGEIEASTQSSLDVAAARREATRS